MCPFSNQKAGFDPTVEMPLLRSFEAIPVPQPIHTQDPFTSSVSPQRQAAGGLLLHT
jgi:hypothetical protein